MAKLSNTQIYGNLNVSDTIYCKDLYVDKAGLASGVYFSIGDIASTKYFKVTSTLLEINSSLTSPIGTFYSTHATPDGVLIGYDANNNIAMTVDNGSTDPNGMIEFNSNAGSGELTINNASTVSTRSIAMQLNGTTFLTVSGDGVTLQAVDPGAALKIGDVDGTGNSLSILLSDGKLLSNSIEANGTVTITGSATVGSVSGATSADTRYYFGTGSSYIQRDPSNYDGVPMIGISESLAFLNNDSELHTYVDPKHGFSGPQIGWQPRWFDDFSTDSSSNYTLTSMTMVFNTYGTITLEKFMGPVISGSSIIPSIEITPEKVIQTSLGSNRYFVIRSKNRSSGETFSSGTIYWMTTSDTAYTSNQSVDFILAHPSLTSSNTRTFYETWVDLHSAGDAYWVDLSNPINKFKFEFNNPEGTGTTPQVSAMTMIFDYWGVGHRGFESVYSSSDYYNAGSKVEVAGDLHVSGNTTLSAVSATTIYAPHNSLSGLSNNDHPQYSLSAHTHSLTHQKMIYIEEPESTDVYPIVKVAKDMTISRLTHKVDTGTIDFNLDVRAEGTPETSGTNVWTAYKQATTASTVETSFTSSAVTDNQWLVYAASGTTGTPTKLWVSVEYTED